MTACGDIRIELGGYVLGGLEPDEVAAVDAHLEVCGRCSAELAELSSLPELLALADTAAVRAPADLRQRVLRRRNRRQPRVHVRVAAAIAVLAALTGGVVVSALDRPAAPDLLVAMRGPEPVGVVGSAELLQLEVGVQVALDLGGVRTGDEGYYHVWMERGERRVSAGTFVGGPDGRARAELLCGGRLEDYDRLTVTWHPRGRQDEVVAVEADLTA